jgi:hypothetical protein
MLTLERQWKLRKQIQNNRNLNQRQNSLRTGEEENGLWFQLLTSSVSCFFSKCHPMPLQFLFNWVKITSCPIWHRKELVAVTKLLTLPVPLRRRLYRPGYQDGYKHWLNTVLWSSISAVAIGRTKTAKVMECLKKLAAPSQVVRTCKVHRVNKFGWEAVRDGAPGGFLLQLFFNCA